MDSTIDPTETSNSIEDAARAEASRFLEQVWNQGDLADLADEKYMAIVSAFRTGFPDLHLTIDELLVKRKGPNRAGGFQYAVMSLASIHGIHQGEFMGIAPTGNEATWTRVDVMEVFTPGHFNNGEGGVERLHGGNWDAVSLMQQLGVTLFSALPPVA